MKQMLLLKLSVVLLAASLARAQYNVTECWAGFAYPGAPFQPFDSNYNNQLLSLHDDTHFFHDDELLQFIPDSSGCDITPIPGCFNCTFDPYDRGAEESSSKITAHTELLAEQSGYLAGMGSLFITLAIPHLYHDPIISFVPVNGSSQDPSGVGPANFPGPGTKWVNRTDMFDHCYTYYSLCTDLYHHKTLDEGAMYRQELGDGKYRLCGVVQVQGWETFTIWGTETFTREVVDRITYCIEFNPRYALAWPINSGPIEGGNRLAVTSAPDVFSLLTAQAVVSVDPEAVAPDCVATIQITLVTLVQHPYSFGDNPVLSSDAFSDATMAKDNERTTGCDGRGADEPNCITYWEIDFCVDECEAVGMFDLQLFITCRPDAPCPITQPYHANITASFNTADFCGVLTHVVGLTGSLESFQDPSMEVARDDYATIPNATNIYFKLLTVSADALIESTQLTYIDVEFPYGFGGEETLPPAGTSPPAEPAAVPAPGPAPGPAPTPNPYYELGDEGVHSCPAGYETVTTAEECSEASIYLDLVYDATKNDLTSDSVCFWAGGGTQTTRVNNGYDIGARFVCRLLEEETIPPGTPAGTPIPPATAPAEPQNIYTAQGNQDSAVTLNESPEVPDSESWFQIDTNANVWDVHVTQEAVVVTITVGVEVTYAGTTLLEIDGNEQTHKEHLEVSFNSLLEKRGSDVAEFPKTIRFGRPRKKITEIKPPPVVEFPQRTPDENEKESNDVLWIGLAALVGALICCTASFLFWRQRRQKKAHEVFKRSPTMEADIDTMETERRPSRVSFVRIPVLDSSEMSGSVAETHESPSSSPTNRSGKSQNHTQFAPVPVLDSSRRIAIIPVREYP